MGHRIADLDRRLSAALAAVLARPGRERIARAVIRISETGSYGIGWIVLFAVVAVLGAGWQQALVAAGSVVVALLVNSLVKLVVRRPRPVSPVGQAPSSWSFPSAHTTMAVVGAACMTVLLPALTALWVAVAVVLAASRVLLGVHYVGDVLAGALLGLALAVPAVALLERVG